MTFCMIPLRSIAPSPVTPYLTSTRPVEALCSCQSQLPQQHWCLSILGECRHTPKLLNGQAKNSSGWIWLGWFMRLWVIQLCRGVRRAREWSERAQRGQKQKFACLLRYKTTGKKKSKNGLSHQWDTCAASECTYVVFPENVWYCRGLKKNSKGQKKCFLFFYY